MNIIRFYLDKRCCQCEESRITAEPEHNACRDARKKLHGTDGQLVAWRILCTLFECIENKEFIAANGLPLGAVLSGGNDGDDSADDEDDDCSDMNGS